MLPFGSAQDTPASQPATSSSSVQQQTQQTPGKSEEANGTGKPAPKGTSNDRLFYALPNFLSLENTGKIPPLSSKEKFKVVTRGAFDYIEYPWYGLLSAINQADDAEPAYGQGWGAYGKRYATSFADGTIENFITSAILPSILHQDPRFYHSEAGGFTHKAGYAVSRIFLTRTDSGGTAKLYLNGKLAGTADGIKEPFNWKPFLATVRLGVNYIGLFDELSMYDRALSDAEVEALYHLDGGVATLMK